MGTEERKEETMRICKRHKHGLFLLIKMGKRTEEMAIVIKQKKE